MNTEEAASAVVATLALTMTGEGRRDSLAVAQDRSLGATQIITAVRIGRQQIRQSRFGSANSGSVARQWKDLELGTVHETMAAVSASEAAARASPMALEVGRSDDQAASTEQRAAKPANWSDMTRTQQRHWYKRNG